MSASLLSIMVSSGNTIYHSPEFLTFVHAHKSLLMAGSVNVALDPEIVHKFEYNFTSLLIELGYPVENLIIMMTVNGFTCPTQMRKDFKELKVPSPEIVGVVKRMFRQVEARI